MKREREEMCFKRYMIKKSRKKRREMYKGVIRSRS